LLLRTIFPAPAAAIALLLPAPAGAVDIFEIQVYEGDINHARQAGVELHTNFVAAGRAAPAFDGEAVPDRSLRLTVEPSLGVLPFWELGAYLQLDTAPGRSQAHFGGYKLRSKLVIPREHTGHFTVGLNMEVGRGVAVLGSNDWDSEVRPIISWEWRRWFVAINPIVGWALSGSTSVVPQFEPCAKVRLDAGHQVGVGFEYYAGLGRFDAIPAFREQEHVLYLVGDLLDGPIELNAGIGRGLSAATDAWTFKAIVGKTF
jgi:hypothetical protein